MLNKCVFRMYLFYTSIYELAFMTDQTFIIHCCYCCLVTKLCLSLCNPVDCSLPGSFVLGISHTGMLEWVAISFSRRSSCPKDYEPTSPAFQVDS